MIHVRSREFINLLRKGTLKKENRNRTLEKCKKYWHSLVLVLDQGNEFLIEDAAFAKPSNLQKIKGSSKYFATASKTFMLMAVY